jgi:hypothetical protein
LPTRYSARTTSFFDRSDASCAIRA